MEMAKLINPSPAIRVVKGIPRISNDKIIPSKVAATGTIPFKTATKVKILKDLRWDSSLD